MTTKTFTVRGHKVATASKCRYAVVVVRERAVTTERGTYVAFARVHKRTDNIDTARTIARRHGIKTGHCIAVVVDTTTGEEV